MNKNLNTAAKLAALGAVAMLAGCAFVPDTVHPQYIPQANVQKIPGADKVVVDVVVENEKKHPHQVSSTVDSFGISMAGVYMHPVKDFQDAVDAALMKRGFHIHGNENKTVKITIRHFYFHLHQGFFTASQTGNTDLDVVVLDKNGKQIYEKHIKYLYHNGGIFGLEQRSHAARIMLNGSVKKIVDNIGFINALMQ